MAAEPSNVSQEITKLRRLSGAVIAWLGLVIVGALVEGITLLNSSDSSVGTQAWLCVTAGILGSGVAALRSVGERVANGWQLASGHKVPAPRTEQEANRECFVGRMTFMFVTRPLLGGVVGLLAYTGLVGGYLVAAVQEHGSTPRFSMHGLAFLALLAGVFAKTFLDRLGNWFKVAVK